MPTGEGSVTKVILSKADENFIVIVESQKDVEAWRKDKSIALAQVVDSFKVFVTLKHGNQGILNTPSKSTLENSFGTDNEDEIIKTILEEGYFLASSNKARESSTNDSKGSMSSHR